mgnify:CR=1 FL=1
MRESEWDTENFPWHYAELGEEEVVREEEPWVAPEPASQPSPPLALGPQHGCDVIFPAVFPALGPVVADFLDAPEPCTGARTGRSGRP